MTMAAYTDPERQHSIQSYSEIELNKEIWVELQTRGLNEQMVVPVIDSCWATNHPSPSGSLRYDLIIKG